MSLERKNLKITKIFSATKGRRKENFQLILPDRSKFYAILGNIFQLLEKKYRFSLKKIVFRSRHLWMVPRPDSVESGLGMFGLSLLLSSVGISEGTVDNTKSKTIRGRKWHARCGNSR